jgi:3-oxoacyl-[acyl-carrier protein] reductase
VELSGKVALITGSTGDGMGRQIALALARDGADIVLNYGTGRPQNAAAARRIAEEIRRFGRRCIAVRADTRSAAAVFRMFRAARKALGTIDLLVANAGGDWRLGDYTGIPPKRFREVVQAELDGAFYCLQAAAPEMRKRGFGRIVLVSMQIPDNWKALAQDYTIGKVARTALMRGLYRRELRHGITMNVVSPGPVPGVSFGTALDLRDHGPAWVHRAAPTTQDVAEIVRFLCSDSARYVSGTEVLVPSWAFANP